MQLLSGQVVCEAQEVLASGCAVSRAFPVYNEKSSCRPLHRRSVEVGFIPVGEEATPFGEEEARCLNMLCEGVRLAQEIVDMPTNHMHTDAFLDVSAYNSIPYCS